MELTQLIYFRIAAYHQNFSRAAEDLNITQPALSSVINRLEAELGVTLFDRRGRSIYLNENGKVFLEKANHILGEIDDAKHELNKNAGIRDTSISLAVSSSQYLFGMHTFMNQHPEYKWNLSVEGNDAIIPKLDMRKIDFAITSPGIYGINYTSILLLHDTFKLAVHKDNPLSKKKTISLNDVTNERFIMLARNSSFQKQVDRIFNDYDISPNYVIECDHLLRRELINSNAGITIASHSAAFRHLFNEDIRFIDIKEISTYSRDIVLVYLKDKYLNEATKLFINFIKEKFNKST